MHGEEAALPYSSAIQCGSWSLSSHVWGPRRVHNKGTIITIVVDEQVRTVGLSQNLGDVGHHSGQRGQKLCMGIGVARQCLGKLQSCAPAKNAPPTPSPGGSVDARLCRRPADHLASPGRQAASTPRNAEVPGELAAKATATQEVEPYHAQIGLLLVVLVAFGHDARHTLMSLVEQAQQVRTAKRQAKPCSPAQTSTALDRTLP